MRITLAIKMIQVLRDFNIVSLRSCSPYRKTGPGLNLLRKKNGLRRLSGLKRDSPLWHPEEGRSLFLLTAYSLLFIICKEY
jgi:hypothetical protein